MKLDQSQMPILVASLEEHFPASLNVYHLARNGARQSRLAWPGLEFFVDAFPNFQACICRMPNNKEAREMNLPPFLFANAVLPFSKDARKLEELLATDGIVDWSGKVGFCMVSNPDDLDVVRKVTAQHGGSLSKAPNSTGSGVIVHFDLTKIALSYSLPGEFYLDSLKTEHADQIARDRNFNNDGLECLRYILQVGYPSMAIFTKADGKPIAYICLRPEMKLGIGFVAEQYRARGFFKIVSYELLKKLRESGEREAYTDMSPQTKGSLHAMLGIGGTLYQGTFEWLEHIPETVTLS
ncbi:hypothetical protein BV898_12251 [Hypsibius exemplaris]|uniref:Glycine N-acyltransferase-like protein n=1 Tax=Hypsibius exemplaris TaxID=2072580 RepID=A0A1W0WE67_HYPEX|nr:hypothetical protein BV898_12251 [Hypsibius exemplaris]